MDVAAYLGSHASWTLTAFCNEAIIFPEALRLH